ncbi:MAG: hypothetical protein QM831_16475 [Kofleriaceae bacterium]
MGTAALALVAVAALSGVAVADECTGTTDNGGRFAQCFDVGNRLSVFGAANGAAGFGTTIQLRHELTFSDDPDLMWKMEHVLVDSTYSLRLDGADNFEGTLYRGRYLRHARDGHIVIPTGGEPKKVFLPFDVGAVFEIGELDWHADKSVFSIGVVRVAPLIELARSTNYRRIFAIGPAMHWDMDVDRMFELKTEHTIAPFTDALAMLRLESNDGLYVAELRGEAGTAWHNGQGWKPEARAQAELERILIAIDDRPVALTAGAKYDSARDELSASVGLRVVLVDRTDPRVSLHPLHNP